MLRSIIAACALAGLAHAHGYMSAPPSRNIDDYCKQCLNGGGTGSVNADGKYIHGMCGNGPDEPQTWNVPGSVVATFEEGQAITIELVITANHMGFFEFQLCNTPDISEECFAQHRLLRSGCADTSDPNCYRAWKPLMASEAQAYAAQSLEYSGPTVPGSTIGVVSYKMSFDLPSGVACSHCVLRWHYYSTNSCPPLNADHDPSFYGEEFWNCADIAIEAAGGGQTPAADPVSDKVQDRLLHTMPEDLRPLGLGQQCPERALGFPRDYEGVVCWFEGTQGDCSV